MKNTNCMLTPRISCKDYQGKKRKKKAETLHSTYLHPYQYGQERTGPPLLNGYPALCFSFQQSITYYCY